ncbi:MAG TPA: hypothetical protein DIS79_03090 [Bacteroidetes bacterium]|nr:hypothetical protein [Bacteroidota bacterium]HRK03554.1 FkbM family methyltransferase [Chlorobiota bacterium]
MKTLLRRALRLLLKPVFRFFPREHGKYSLLTRLYFPFAAPTHPQIVIARLRHGFKMYLDISEYLQSYMYMFGAYELPTVKLIRNTFQGESSFLDIGAQMGYITLEAAVANKRGHVFAFEPEPANFTRLIDNISINSINSIRTYNTALGATTGDLDLYLAEANSGAHSAFQSNANVSEKKVRVPMRTLDSIVEQDSIKDISMIKLDVEGYELEVLRGATQVLRQHKPMLIVELNDEIQQAAGSSSSGVKQLLGSFGYQPHYILEDGRIGDIVGATNHLNDNVVFVCTK